MKIVKVGAIVTVGELDNLDGKLKPFPSVVIESNSPDDPQGLIGAFILSYAGGVPRRSVAFSESLAPGAWSWPS
jgi:hypothetical protein